MVGIVGVYAQTGDCRSNRIQNVHDFKRSVVHILLAVDITQATDTSHLTVPASEEHDVPGTFPLLHKFDGLRAGESCRGVRHTNPRWGGVEIEYITRDPNTQILNLVGLATRDEVVA